MNIAMLGWRLRMVVPLLTALLTGALYVSCASRDVGRDAEARDGRTESSPFDGKVACTLSMCRVNEAGTEACCFNDESPPPKPYHVCCTGVVHATELCAYNSATNRYMTFCDYCRPPGWAYAATGTGTCP